MSRDDLLFWLNDRCGLVVSAQVAASGDDGPYRSILSTEGVLRHWRAGLVTACWPVGYAGPDPAEGVYSIGDDPGDARPARRLQPPGGRDGFAARRVRCHRSVARSNST